MLKEREEENETLIAQIKKGEEEVARLIGQQKMMEQSNRDEIDKLK